MKWIPVFVALLLLSGCAAQAQNQPGYRQINMEEAIAMMETESDYRILDVRTPEEFSQNHIPGAINIANETIGSEEIPELPDKNDTQNPSEQTALQRTLSQIFAAVTP